jgi:hypothetical protein
MTAGVKRSDAAYIWPPQLLRPDESRKLVYLDLNHWINLAKAATGHHAAEKRYQRALTALRASVASETISVVLAGAHYMELAGIRNVRQRSDLASLMEELTEFRTLLSRVSVLTLEVDAALEARIGARPDPYPAVNLVGNGVFHAFGLRGGLRVRDDAGNDVTDEVRNASPFGADAFDARIAQAERDLERAMLAGPANEQEAADLRSNGWRPELTRQMASERAEAEEQHAKRLAADSGWRRGRTRDFASGVYLATDLINFITEGIAARVASPADGFPVLAKGEDVQADDTELPDARHFADAMPASDVAITLLAARYRNTTAKWKPNDISDIEALAVAASYCDVVATDGAVANTLCATHLDSRLQTVVTAQIDDVTDYVERATTVSPSG